MFGLHESFLPIFFVIKQDNENCQRVISTLQQVVINRKTQA